MDTYSGGYWGLGLDGVGGWEGGVGIGRGEERRAFYSLSLLFNSQVL